MKTFITPIILQLAQFFGALRPSLQDRSSPFWGEARRGAWALLLLLLVASCGSPSYTNYYFDAHEGNDSNTGTNPAKPLKSLAKLAQLAIKGGDSILLKSGSVFTEQLYFHGKGQPGKPVVIGKYGGEAKPHLKGDASLREMVHIYNSEYVVLRDLEVSNKGAQPTPLLKGVFVELYNYGTGKDITLDNLHVHDVYGSLYKGDGYTHAEAGAGTAIDIVNVRGNGPDSILSNYDRLLVQNCLIENSQRNGIMMWGNWIRKHWKPSLNVVIRNNVLDGIPGDGIVPVGCDGVVVEYNVMRNSPKTLPPTEACDGIWPWGCDNAVIQYNIVGDHNSQVDGYAFDSDYDSRNSLFQYNLSYNNAGGFLLLCNSGGWPEDFSAGNVGTVVRYNVSINDGTRSFIVKNQKDYFSPVIHITGPTLRSRIEKNIFYLPRKEHARIDKRIVCSDDWRGYSDSTWFNHNYIYIEEPHLAYEATKSTNNFFEGNVYVGKLATPGSGFSQHKGNFDKSVWYDANDPHWGKLVKFLKDKTIPYKGKETRVLEILGYE